MITVLHEGFKFPFGEKSAHSLVPLNHIEGLEVSWALGVAFIHIMNLPITNSRPFENQSDSNASATVAIIFILILAICILLMFKSTLLNHLFGGNNAVKTWLTNRGTIFPLTRKISGEGSDNEMEMGTRLIQKRPISFSSPNIHSNLH